MRCFSMLRLTFALTFRQGGQACVTIMHRGLHVQDGAGVVMALPGYLKHFQQLKESEPYRCLGQS